MDGNHVSWDVTHHTARDVRPDVALDHRHHGHGRGSGQPVGLVVAARIVADVVEVAEDERHGAEAL